MKVQELFEAPGSSFTDELEAMFANAGFNVKAKFQHGDDAVDDFIDLKAKWKGKGVSYGIQIAEHSGKTFYYANFYSGSGKNYGSLQLGEFKTARAAALTIIKHIKENGTLQGLQEANQHIDLRDPDRDVGAVEREGNARASLGKRQEAAVIELNKLSKKYNLGAKFKTGEYMGLSGQHIKVENSHGSKFADTNAVVEMCSVSYRNGDSFKVVLSNATLSKTDVDYLNAYADKHIDNFYETYVESKGKEVTISLYSASGMFSDPKKVKAINTWYDMIVDELKAQAH